MIVSFITGVILENKANTKVMQDLEMENKLLSSELEFTKSLLDEVSKKVKKETKSLKKHNKTVLDKLPVLPVKEKINLKTTSLDTILKKEMKNPKFKKTYEKEKSRLEAKRAKKVTKK